MQEELFAGLNCQPGFVCSRSELSQDLRSLLQSGLFANVDARVQRKSKGKYTLEFTFSENLWQPMKSFKVPCPFNELLFLALLLLRSPQHALNLLSLLREHRPIVLFLSCHTHRRQALFCAFSHVILTLTSCAGWTDLTMQLLFSPKQQPSCWETILMCGAGGASSSKQERAAADP